MDELAARVAREAVVLEGRSVGVAAVDRRPGRTREVAAHASAAFDRSGDGAGNAPTRADDAPGFVGAEAEDLGRSAVLGDAGAGCGQRQVGILRGAGAIMDPILQMVRVRAAELATEVVVAHAVLGAAGFEAERMRPRVEPEIVAAEFEGGEFGAEQAGDLAAVAAAGEEVDALVGAPLHAVRHPLDVDQLHPRAEAREDLFAVIGDAMAGAVLEAPDVGRRDDVEAAVSPDESGRPGQVVGEDAAGLVIAVAVLVFQHRHAAEVRDLVAAFGVVDHLADEHPAAFVEADRDRVADLRFVRGQLELEAGLHLPGRNGRGGLDGGVAGELFRGIDRRRALGFPVGLLVGRRALDAVGREGGQAGQGQQGDAKGRAHGLFLGAPWRERRPT